MADSSIDYGGLLGGTNDSLVAPLIGQQGIDSARTNALLNFASGLLQAGAPHYGAPTGFGGALASGFKSAQDAYQNSIGNSLKGALTSQQIAQQRFQMMQKVAGMRSMANLLGQPDPTAGMSGMPGSGTTAAAAPISSNTPNMAIPAGGAPLPDPTAAQALPVAPPPSNLGMGGAAPITAGPSMGAAAPAANPQAALAATASVPGATPANTPPLPAAIAKAAPSDAAIFAAGGPMSPALYGKIQTVAALTGDTKASAIWKNIYEARGMHLTNVNGLMVDANDPRTKNQFIPSVDKGQTYDPTTGTVANANGAVGSAAAMAGAVANAQESAKAANTIGPPVVNPNGSTGYASVGTILGNGQPAPPSTGGVLAPQPGGMVNGAPVPQSPMLASLAPSQKQALDTAASSGAKIASDAITAGVSAQNTVLPGLQNLKTMITQAPVGPGGEIRYDIGKIAGALGLQTPAGQNQTAQLQEIKQQLQGQGISQLKALFPGRVTNTDMNAYFKTLGTINDPKQAVLFANDMRIAAANKQVQFGQFASNYLKQAGQGQASLGDIQTAWSNSPAGKLSPLQDPAMLDHFAGTLQQGKPDTPSAGKFAMNVPGKGWVQVVPAPDGGWQPPGWQASGM